MTDPRCETYLDDPARFAAHAADCEKCAKIVAQLDGVDRALHSSLLDGVAIGSGAPRLLPLAPWEGARHRSWRTVAAVAIALVLAATAAFALVGVSPLRGFARVFGGQAQTGVGLLAVVRATGDVLGQAPAIIRFGLLILVVAVNLVLLVLLRRPTRGIDETAR